MSALGAVTVGRLTLTLPCAASRVEGACPRVGQVPGLGESRGVYGRGGLCRWCFDMDLQLLIDGNRDQTSFT